MLQKYGYLIKLIICTAAVYFSMKYLLPLFLPFLIAYAISGCILPIINWLHNHAKINRTIATVVVLVIFVLAVGAALIFLGCQIFHQGMNFVNNLPDGIGSRTQGFIDSNKSKIMSLAMDSTVKSIVIAIEALVFVATTVVAAYFITKDRNKIHEFRKKMRYADAVNRVTGKLKMVFLAYAKAQLIIMLVTACICTVGLYLLGNDYALLLGILISFLDALPLIGIVVILIPWAIYYFFVRKFISGAIIFLIFVVCYIAREVLEPKIMGHNIGMSPIVSIISIYIGYMLFGIIGVVIGPVSYIIIEQLMNEGCE